MQILTADQESDTKVNACLNHTPSAGREETPGKAIRRKRY